MFTQDSLFNYNELLSMRVLPSLYISTKTLDLMEFSVTSEDLQRSFDPKFETLTMSDTDSH